MEVREGKFIFDDVHNCGADVCDDPAAIRQINARVQKILDEAPSDASIQFDSKKVGEGFKGFLRVQSCQTHFARVVTGAGLLDVVDRVFREVSKQICDWKQTRFANASGWSEPWE